MAEKFYFYHNARKFIEEAAEVYEKTAPQLVEWLDEVYIKLSEAPSQVSVFELQQLQQLHMDGVWEQANCAQNRWYKVRSLLCQPVGVLSY